jgi:biopolymer transport protein ExbD
MGKNKQNLDVEVDLVSFISLLSVCICFLLLTAIWIQIGSINVKQAVGGQSAAETKKVPALWTKMQPDGKVVLQFQDFPTSITRKLGSSLTLKGNEAGEIDFENFEKKIAELIILVPDLKTGLVMPQGESKYESVILLMDHMKKSGLVDLGVSPI